MASRPSRASRASAPKYDDGQSNDGSEFEKESSSGSEGEEEFDFDRDDSVLISASRGAAAPSRHRRASSPGMMEVGGLFFDFEAVRTDLTEMLRAGRIDGGGLLASRRETRKSLHPHRAAD